MARLGQASRGHISAACAGPLTLAARTPALFFPFALQEEIYKARLTGIKREEDMVKADFSRLEMEKMVYIRCGGRKSGRSIE